MITDLLRRFFYVFICIGTLYVLASISKDVFVEIPGTAGSVPIPTASVERVYFLVDLLPRKADYPTAFSRWEGCYHLNYDDLVGMGIGEIELRTLALSLSAGGRCVLVYMQPGWAGLPVGHPMSVVRVVRILREAGISNIVIRVHVRINRDMWERMGEIYARAEGSGDWLQAAAQLYGDWVRSWTAPVSGYELDSGESSVARWLSALGVYVQLYNEPNIAEEWSLWDGAEGMFVTLPGTSVRILRDDMMYELGEKVCEAHKAYMRAFFETGVFKDAFGNVGYNLEVLPPRLIIPDIALADAGKRIRYLDGCLNKLARRLGELEYIRLHERMVHFVYGFHIYLLCHGDDPVLQLNGLKDLHLEPVLRKLNELSSSGLQLISGIMVTEFGGAYGPGTGCDREKQKALYSAFTRMFPDVPAFWWVYLGTECGYGTFDRNDPAHWNRAALAAWDANARVFRNCALGEE